MKRSEKMGADGEGVHPTNNGTIRVDRETGEEFYLDGRKVEDEDILAGGQNHEQDSGSWILPPFDS